MNDPADEQRSRRALSIRWETRILATALEGLGAAFAHAWIGHATITDDFAIPFCGGAAAAFLLWPIVSRNDRYDPFRVLLFGFLVVLLASYFILFATTLVSSLDPTLGRRGIGFAITRATSFVGAITALAADFYRLTAGVFFGAVLFGPIIFFVGVSMAFAVRGYAHVRQRADIPPSARVPPAPKS